MQNITQAIVRKGTADATDFETNHKASAQTETNVNYTDYIFTSEITYTAFAALIVNWADVHYVERDTVYELYLEGSTVDRANCTNIASSITNVTLSSATLGRKKWICYNDSTANLYLKFSATASTTSFTIKLVPNAYYEMPEPIYRGIIDGIWDAANGFARITELS